MVLCLLLSNIIVIYCFTSNLLFYVCFMPICPYPLPVAETMLPELAHFYMINAMIYLWISWPWFTTNCAFFFRVHYRGRSHEKNPTKNTMDSHDLPSIFFHNIWQPAKGVFPEMGLIPNHETVSHVWPWVSIETHWLTMTYETPMFKAIKTGYTAKLYYILYPSYNMGYFWNIYNIPS